MNRTTKGILCIVFALLLGLALSCGGVEEEGDPTGDVESNAGALVKYPITQDCPSGYFRVSPACDTEETWKCYKCCPIPVPGQIMKAPCITSPGCAGCNYNACFCWWPGIRYATSCVVYYHSTYGWVWRCSYSDGTTCLFYYFTSQVISCS